MINVIPPALIFIVGIFLVPLLRGKAKSVYLLLLPVISFINLIYIPYGTHGVINFLDYQIIFCKIDKLSLLFGYIFHIIAFLTILYGINMKNDNEYMAGLFYTGCAIGVIFLRRSHLTFLLLGNDDNRFGFTYLGAKNKEINRGRV